MTERRVRTGIGQDSHRVREPKGRPLVLGGLEFDEPFGLEGNSDSDVILHALTNAVSGVTGRPVLGPRADALCKAGVTDSRAYLRAALEDLEAMGYRVVHASVSLECARPKILPRLQALRASVGSLLGLEADDVGITATSGEGLTEFGRGLGIQAIAIVTAEPR